MDPVARNLGDSEDSPESLQNALKNALNDLDPCTETTDSWRNGFQIVRRLRRVLLDYNVAPGDVDIIGLEALVEVYADYHDLDVDGTLCQFHSCWRIVQLPEGQDPASLAFNVAIRNQHRLQADRDHYATDSQHEDAEIILNTFFDLQE